MGVEMVTGRKRTNVVDALGFLVAVAVCAASADDAKAARPALAELGPDRCPRLASGVTAVAVTPIIAAIRSNSPGTIGHHSTPASSRAGPHSPQVVSKIRLLAE